MKRHVIFYQTDDGWCPVREFLDGLPGKAAQKVVWGTLSLLEELDSLPSTYFKKLVNSEDIGKYGSLWELMPIEFFASSQATQSSFCPTAWQKRPRRRRLERLNVRKATNGSI
jgi:hypothetical protein